MSIKHICFKSIVNIKKGPFKIKRWSLKYANNNNDDNGNGDNEDSNSDKDNYDNSDNDCGVENDDDNESNNDINDIIYFHSVLLKKGSFMLQ